MVKDPAAQRIRPTPTSPEAQPGIARCSPSIPRMAALCGMKLLVFWGVQEVRGALPPSALPGISPSRGEIDLRRGFAPLNV
ncbi:hypothetical protein GSF67_07290 [Agrobacterium sp. CGMCC 11546]|nr:hypothetical protein GSF67_07290 [Agrobacterium sp. CGMCC 11546]